ncbi:MAG: hypothetical protein Q4F72_02170 [Desulfovibrionaceae bacterium]|nr:hypothetical protein [Desulfovibrionaceae bacterium]
MRTVSYFGHQFLLVTLAVLVGYAALVAAYSLPVGMMAPHMAASVRHFGDLYPQPVTGSGQLDLFSDSVMLLTSAHPNRGPAYRDALLGERYHKGDSPDSRETMRDVYGEGAKPLPDGVRDIGYGRYWHGYTVLLKPLLCLTDYGTIRALNMFLQCALFACVLLLCARRGERPLGLAATFFWLAANPLATMLCLQFSAVTVITLLGMACMLLKKDDFAASEFAAARCFTLTGIAIAYFDLLSFPLLSLGLPLLFHFHLLDKSRLPLTALLRRLVLCGLSWLTGYAGMWLGKWILAWLIADPAIFDNVIAVMLFRTGHSVAGHEFTFADILLRQFGAAGWPVLALFALAMAGSVFLVRRQGGFAPDMKALTPCLLLTVMPFVWYAVMENHSYVHFWFTYRNLAIAGCGLLLLLFGAAKKSGLSSAAAGPADRIHAAGSRGAGQ